MPMPRAADLSTRSSLKLLVSGRVQGVGFRPFVARLARALTLAGSVRNTREGVLIVAAGPRDALETFQRRLVDEAPAMASLQSITRLDNDPLAAEGSGFEILPSLESRTDEGSPVVEITPDLATCSRCLAEFHDASNRRHGYALNGCTDCGPRFTLLVTPPFDRPRSTMSDFPLCRQCLEEYHNLDDRRFHAQIISCPQCGPYLEWLPPGAPADPRTIALQDGNDLAAIARSGEQIKAGKILAVKGVGGFHLLCDATNENAVRRLRDRKRRDRKPFAVLFATLEQVERHARLDDFTRQALASAAAPIVLVPRLEGASPALARSIAPGLNSLGVMLAYSLTHRALVDAAESPLVATSANASNEAMPIDFGTARRDLADVVDAFLIHRRRIVRHADDSVTRVISNRAVTLRVGRGLAPARFALPRDVPGMIALGGHLKAAIALARGRELFLGQHIGDLDTPSARKRYRETLEDLRQLLAIDPTLIVHDQHPDYFTTQLAPELGAPTLAIQHHHAHVASCLAEHGETGPVLGIAWDGTGHGSDGTIWGGEFLEVGPRGHRRVASLWPFKLLGGDRAAREPRLCAAGVLHAAGLPIEEGLIPPEQLGLVRRLFEIDSPRLAKTTSAGRLFDAWAGLLGLSEHSAYEGEAAIRLEEAASPEERGAFAAVFTRDPTEPGLTRLDWRPWVEETRAALRAGVPASRLAARFQNGLAEGSLEIARRVGLETVVLSGGCFQNKALSERHEALLSAAGFRVLTHRRVPPGDGGLAVGQLWAAAMVRSMSDAGPAPVLKSTSE